MQECGGRRPPMVVAQTAQHRHGATSILDRRWRPNRRRRHSHRLERTIGLDVIAHLSLDPEPSKSCGRQRSTSLDRSWQ